MVNSLQCYARTMGERVCEKRNMFSLQFCIQMEKKNMKMFFNGKRYICFSCVRFDSLTTDECVTKMTKRWNERIYSQPVAIDIWKTFRCFIVYFVAVIDEMMLNIVSSFHVIKISIRLICYVNESVVAFFIFVCWSLFFLIHKDSCSTHLCVYVFCVRVFSVCMYGSR